jgi:hypothetical protein
MLENISSMTRSPKIFVEYLPVKRGLRLPTHRQRRFNDVPSTAAGITVGFDGEK